MVVEKLGGALDTAIDDLDFVQPRRLRGLTDWLVVSCTHISKHCMQRPHYHIVLPFNKGNAKPSSGIKRVKNAIKDPDHLSRKYSCETIKSPWYPLHGFCLYLACGLYDPDEPRRCKKFIGAAKDSDLYKAVEIARSCPGHLHTEHKRFHGNDCAPADTAESSQFVELISRYGPIPIREVPDSNMPTSLKQKLVRMTQRTQRIYDDHVRIFVAETVANTSWRNVFRKVPNPQNGFVINPTDEELKEGADHLEALLSFQDPLMVGEFCTFLGDLLDGKTGKIGTMWISGPRDCGKSLIARVIKQCLVFHGDIAHSKNFVFGNMVGKKIIHFEELSSKNIKPSVMTALKKIFEGDTQAVDVKYAPIGKAGGCPVLVTSNETPDQLAVELSDDKSHRDALLTRIKHFKFTRGFDTEQTFVIHPLSIITLVDRHYDSELQLRYYKGHGFSYSPNSKTFKCLRPEETVLALPTLTSLDIDAFIDNIM